MLSVSFGSMTTMSSSQERSAVVEFFRVVSRYNRKQFTNALAVAMIIVDPIIKNSPIEITCAKEYLDGIIEVLNSIELFGKDYNFDGIDVDGVVLFFIELLTETPRDYTTFNYSVIILIVTLIGFGDKRPRNDSIDLLSNYVMIDVDDRNTQIDLYIEQIIKNFLSRITFTQQNQILTNSFLRLMSSLITKRCDIYIHLITNKVVNDFQRFIETNLKRDMRKLEELHFLSCLICVGHNSEEKLWFEEEIEKWGGVEWLVSLLITESQSTKNAQNAFISFGETINYFIDSKLDSLTLLKKAKLIPKNRQLN